MNYFFEMLDIQHVFLWLCVFLCYFAYNFMRKPKYNLPPGPRGLPILGYLPFLGRNPHEELSKLGEKYGGIFSLRIGRKNVVIVTDVAIIKKLFNKSSTSDRPPDMFQFMPGGLGLTEKNGSEWIEQRRHTLTEMRNLGFGKSRWEELVQMEISDVLELLAQTKGEPTDISKILSASISNNVLSLVTNRRLPMGHPGRDITDRGVESFETIYNPTGIINYYPKLFRLFVKFGILRLEQKLNDMLNLNTLIRKEIENIKQEGGERHSYITLYLNEIERNKQQNIRNSFNENNLVGNVQVLVLAGSDTTYVSIFWLLLAMALHPEIQEKVHEELDAVLVKHETIQWVDRQKLPYCLACIMEGQRWRTVVPLNVIHRASENIAINGYDIPRGTDIISVIWAVHNDKRYWKDPGLFQPERFLSKDGKVTNEPEAYLPFSFGKRICLGKTVALIEIFQYFVSVMQKFQVLPASDMCQPDPEGFPGITFQPKRQPLRFVLR